MNLHMQWMTLLWMVFSGALMGVIYDSYRIVSGQLQLARIVNHTLDVIYWVAAALFVFQNLYHSNYGELRFYVFLGLFIGVWIYFLFLSFITERFVVTLMKVTSYIYKLIVKMISVVIVAPVLGIFKVLKLLLLWLWVVVVQIGKIVCKIVFVPVWKLFAWATKPLWKYFFVPKWLRNIQRKLAVLWKKIFHRN
ncbi:Spore protein YabQ [compost metagenome]